MFNGRRFQFALASLVLEVPLESPVGLCVHLRNHVVPADEKYYGPKNRKRDDYKSRVGVHVGSNLDESHTHIIPRVVRVVVTESVFTLFEKMRPSNGSEKPSRWEEVLLQVFEIADLVSDGFHNCLLVIVSSEKLGDE